MQSPTPKIGQSTASEDVHQRQAIQLESPKVSAARNPAIGALAEVEAEEDAPLSSRFAEYRGTPEAKKGKKMKQQPKGGASSAH